VKDFFGKVAVITGAASGIGRALAGRCHTLGMKLVLADVEEEALAITEQEMRACGASPLTLRTDVSCAADIETLAEKTLASYGAVHLLFNNAGVGLVGPTVWENTAADWEWILGVNLWGVIHALRVFVPVMLEQGHDSHIVNTASTAGLVPAPGMAAYAATKHALVSLSESLYHELGERGARIHVSVLCPGIVDTRILEASRNRPVALQNTLAEEIKRDVRHARELSRMRQASTSGVSADDLAGSIFDGIMHERLYVLTHGWVKDAVQKRAEEIIAERNPAPPPRVGHNDH
jgi:NAD(P)-dependent dehydrogenase (short-subunit alcohol dehydrogenase family)